jgi:hypothetical protein
MMIPRLCRHADASGFTVHTLALLRLVAQVYIAVLQTSRTVSQTSSAVSQTNSALLQRNLTHESAAERGAHVRAAQRVTAALPRV